MAGQFPRPNDEIRNLILRYLYDRNSTATSARGKKGAAVKIMELRRELKALHGLTAKEVVSNLTYLISQGWVDKQVHARVVPVNGGQQIPSETEYFVITASGIDKIEGPGEFTPRDRFAGIVNIHASGQSPVVVGDGNQVDVKYQDEGESLASLAEAIKECDEITVNEKMKAITLIDSIQSQLDSPEPEKSVIRSAWSAIEPLTKIATLTRLCLVNQFTLF